ncbi:hypothetical protein Rcae01_05177 [Novipirellula caenicola]|uniref:Uncharacterized protein n=1 Tax=Novipirellula caenicola TaxID=1536901 RepID=A0ABP9W0M1_9BACT
MQGETKWGLSVLPPSLFNFSFVRPFGSVTWVNDRFPGYRDGSAALLAISAVLEGCCAAKSEVKGLKEPKTKSP